MAAGRREHRADRVARYALGLCALAIALAFLAILGVLVQHSLDAWRHAGLGLLTGTTWDPVNGEYGAWPFVFGTLFTSLLALALALPIGVAVALFLTELAPAWLRGPLGILVELLAGVPSLVYGMWGIFVLAPILRKPVEPWLEHTFASVPGLNVLFSGPKIGLGFLLAGLVLAIMILPTLVAISRDALLAVPRLEREAAYALGGTRWEVARNALRSAKSGVFAASTLGLGRALGETIAVTLVIGNVATAVPKLFAPGQTLASTLATQLGEASDPTFVSALIALGLVLFAITLLVNVAAKLVLERPWRRSA